MVALVCGSVAGGLMWRNANRKAPFGVSDSQARSAGFTSAADMEGLGQADTRLGNDAATKEGWNEADFAFLRKALSGGNEHFATTAVVRSAFLVKPDQRRRVVSTLGDRPIPKGVAPCWAFAFKKWAEYPPKNDIVSFLLSSSNPDVVTLAKEMTSNQKDRAVKQ